MNLSKIKLSALLIPIGALGITLGVIYFLFGIFVPSLHFQSIFFVAILFPASILFIAGVVVWLFESKKSLEVPDEMKSLEISNKSKNIRRISLIVGIICFLIIAYIIYSFSQAWG